MCGMHTKEAANHALCSPLDPQYLLPLHHDGKGKMARYACPGPLPYNNFSREGVHLPSPMV